MSDSGRFWEMAMTDPSAAETRPSRMSAAAALGWPVVCVVWGIGLLILCGGALAFCWRLIDLHERQQQDQLKVARDFHVDLIGQMQALVGHSAASVTSDLCRVRFRLRLPNRQTPPARTYRVVLRQNPGPAEVLLENRRLAAGSEQIADFGMLSPGNYRLMIEDDLAMRCWHDFVVHPGAPVDRVAYCPNYESWMFRPDPVRFRLRFDWPTLWESRPIVAVVHLRSGVECSDGWEWQPPESRQFDGCVVISRDGLQGSLESACRALPASLAGKSDVLPVVVDEDAQPCVVVPYACCEVYGVSLLLAVPDEAATYRHLGTFLYDADGLQSAEAGRAEAGILILPHECCRQVCRGPEPVDLPIPLPELIVPSVLHVAEQARPEGV